MALETIKSLDYIDPFQPFGITNETLNASTEYPLHRHEFIELVYVATGKSTHILDGKAYPIAEGDILFIAYNQSHSFTADTDLTYFNLLIKPEYISESLINAESIYDIFSFFVLDNYFENPMCHIPMLHFSGSQKLEMDTLAEKMHKETLNKEPGYELALEGYMRLLFSRIIRTLHSRDTQQFYDCITPHLLAHIDANYTKKITLTQLANQCFYNPAYLGRLFKSTFHISLHEYISEKRVAFAKELLATTDDPIDRIAAQVGYSDKKQFYKVFKEKAGCTPKQFRETQGTVQA